jgi:hypothetical protein
LFTFRGRAYDESSGVSLDTRRPIRADGDTIARFLHGLHLAWLRLTLASERLQKHPAHAESATVYESVRRSCESVFLPGRRLLMVMP